MVYNNRRNWKLQNPGGRKGLSVWGIARTGFILCHAVMKRLFVKAFSWLPFVLIMFQNVSNACLTFERKKRNHFKEELPSFKQILSDLGLETWPPCDVHKSSPNYRDIEYSACKLRRIPSWKGVDLSFLHEGEMEWFPNLGRKHGQRHKGTKVFS